MAGGTIKTSSGSNGPTPARTSPRGRGYTGPVTTPLALLLARRALALWALAHLVALAILAASGRPAEPTPGLALPAVVTVVFAADLARRGERVLLANLGAGLATVLGTALAAAALAECALAAALGALAR